MYSNVFLSTIIVYIDSIKWASIVGKLGKCVVLPFCHFILSIVYVKLVIILNGIDGHHHILVYPERTHLFPERVFYVCVCL